MTRVDFLELAVDGEIAVNDADATLAGHADADGSGFGDGVHGGGGERDVELELAGELRGGVDFGGQDGGFAREEEDVVEQVRASWMGPSIMREPRELGFELWG